MTEDGLYVCLYTQWNRECPRLAVATSRDLRSWDKSGPAFAKALDGRFRDIPTKSASIVTTVKDGKLVIHRFEGGPFDGKYLMYWGEAFVNLAVSDNLTDWTPLTDDNGDLLRLSEPREGFFDSDLTECGPPAVLTDKGNVLIYNGKNSFSRPSRQEHTAPEKRCSTPKTRSKSLTGWISPSLSRNSTSKGRGSTPPAPSLRKALSIRTDAGSSITAAPTPASASPSATSSIGLFENYVCRIGPVQRPDKIAEIGIRLARKGTGRQLYDLPYHDSAPEVFRLTGKRTPRPLQRHILGQGFNNQTRRNFN